MNLLKDIEAVIFDLDGTLVDSMWIWRNIDIEFLGSRGIKMPDNLQKEIEGKSFSETAIYFKENFGLSESLDEIQEIWNDMAFNKYSTEIKFKPGAKDFVKTLSDAGIKLGIATSNSRNLCEACLRNLGALGYFDTIVTGCDVTCGKPQPDIYLKAAENIGVNPSKCIVFEDVPMGIIAGNTAGMTTCAVYDSYSEFMDNEKKALADYYIDNYESLIEKGFNL